MAGARRPRARPAPSTEPSLGLITAMPPSLPPSALFAVLLQAEPDRRGDRAPAPPLDALDHAVAEAQRDAAAPAQAVVVDALEAGRLLARHAGDRRARAGRSSAAARRRRRCSRAVGASPRAAAHLLALGQAGEPQRGRPGHAALALLVLAGLEHEVARAASPKSSVVTVTGTFTDPAAQQRADRARPDRLHARRPVRAPVVGQERDLRVRLLAAARRPARTSRRSPRAARRRRTRRPPARRSSSSSCARDQRVRARGQPGEHHDEHEQDAQRRPAAAPAARVLGRGQEQRTGPGRVPEGSGTASTSAGHRVSSSSGSAGPLPSVRDEHRRIRERRGRLPAARRAAPARAARALLPDARLRPGRRGRAAGRAAAGVEGARPLRGPQLAALLAVPDRDQHLPGRARARARQARAADRPRPRRARR